MVSGELIFNSCYPKDAPEIILGPDAEEEFQPDIERLEVCRGKQVVSQILFRN